MIVGCPSLPPDRVAPLHVKLANVSASVMLFPAEPAVGAVTVTTAPLDVAGTPTPALFRALAAARFVAASVVMPSSAKFVPVFKAVIPPLSVAPDTVILPPLLVA